MLNTKDALQLYVLLKDGIPEETPDTMLEFTGKIVSRLKESENPENFGKALILMSGKSVTELDEIGNQKRLELFIQGLVDNYVLELVEFGKILGL